MLNRHSNLNGFIDDNSKMSFIFETIYLRSKKRRNLIVIFVFQIFRFDWSHLFSFKSIFHWPWTPDADRIIRNGRSMEMLAIGLIVYTICYVIQRMFNFLIYERYILNSVQQFIDICSMSNISMFLFEMDAYGYYIHGR